MIVKLRVPFGDNRPIPGMPGLDVEGVIAIVTGVATVEEARVVLDAYCNDVNQPKWSAVADIEILTSESPQVFAYVG